MIDKKTIICGVVDYDDKPVHYTKEEQEKFSKMMSNGGEYNVIFDETNVIPMAMKTLIKGNDDISVK